MTLDIIHTLERFQAVFERFVSLPASNPVIITVGQRDGICEGCHIGDHCTEKGQEFSMQTPEGRKRVFANEIEDMCSITAFLNLGHALIKREAMDSASQFPVDQVDYITEPSSAAVPIMHANMVEFQPPVLTNAAFVKTVLSH